MHEESNDSASLHSLHMESKPTRQLRTQLIMASIFSTSYICCGMSIGHSAVLLPELKKNDSAIQIDDNVASLIASIYAMVGPLGGLTSGIIMEFWGRRNSNIIASVGFAIGWILLSAAQNSTIIVYARAIEGFFRTSLLTSLPVHMDETADPWYRGNILTFHGIMFTTGMMIMSSFGAIAQWRTVCILSTLISSIPIFLHLLCQESPSWLVRKNRVKDAENSLFKLCGPGQENKAKEELENLKTRFLTHHPRQNKLNAKNYCMDFVKCFKILFKSNVFKPFIIMHIFSTIQISCGHYILTYYSIDIISRTTTGQAGGIDEYVTNILISSIRTISQIVTFLCMFQIGRRPIAIISGLGSSFSFITLSIVLFLRETNSSPFSPQAEEWINVFLLLMYMGFNTFGYFVLPTLMIGETQNARVRSLVYAYIFTVNDLLLGVILRNYYFILENMKLHGMILVFGVSCLLCTIFVFLFVPETQGKSLEEIEDYFKQPNILWSTRKKYEIEMAEI